MNDTNRRSAAVGHGESGAKVLSPFELHLLFNPQLLQQYRSALEHAIPLLQKQLDCISCAKVFFAWAASALDVDDSSGAGEQVEVQQQLEAMGQRPVQNSLRAGGLGSKGRGRPGSSSSASRQESMVPGKGSSRSRGVAEGALVGGNGVPGGLTAEKLVLLVGQLPMWQSSLAEQVLLQVQKQLRKAAAEAGLLGAWQEGSGRPEALQYDPGGVQGVQVGIHGAPRGPAAAALLGLGDGSYTRSSAGGGERGVESKVELAGCVQAAAEALLQAGVVLEPGLCC
jgi:hypothetical protein